MKTVDGVIPYIEVCDNIQGQFWATLGLENGVQEQTEAAMDIVCEVATDLPHMEGVAVVPVGSRVKGYATLDSDFDLAMIFYDEAAAPFNARMAIGKVITERLGIKVCEPCFPDEADEALTVDMVDYGHVGCFPAEDLLFVLTRALFEGEGVAEFKHKILKMRSEANDTYFHWAERVYNRYLIEPRFTYQGVFSRYTRLIQTEGLSESEYQEIEDSFQNAYAQRLHNFGGSILAKINQQLAQS